MQRVQNASVKVDNRVVGQINQGLLLYLGVMKGDSQKEVKWLASKILKYRIFRDENDKMNRSVLDVGGEVLVVSQFTLSADGLKGNRPSFDLAMAPSMAQGLYENFCEVIRSEGVKVETGIFGAYMQVSSINDGPATFIIEKLPADPN